MKLSVSNLGFTVKLSLLVSWYTIFWVW